MAVVEEEPNYFPFKDTECYRGYEYELSIRGMLAVAYSVKDVSGQVVLNGVAPSAMAAHAAARVDIDNLRDGANFQKAKIADKTIEIWGCSYSLCRSYRDGVLVVTYFGKDYKAGQESIFTGDAPTDEDAHKAARQKLVEYLATFPKVQPEDYSDDYEDALPHYSSYLVKAFITLATDPEQRRVVIFEAKELKGFDAAVPDGWVFKRSYIWDEDRRLWRWR